MTRNHIISAIFLMLFSANAIQGGIIPAQFLHEEGLPNFINVLGIPGIGDAFHNFARSSASAASSAFSGLKSNIDHFRTSLRPYIQVPSQYPLLHQFVHGDIWPNFVNPTIIPGRVPAQGLLGNYGDNLRGSSGATSAGSAVAG